MAPETDDTTPVVDETTPAVPQETGAEPLDAPISELAEFRAARQAERSGEIADEPVAEPVDATNTADEKIVDSSQQVYDPDTGEVLDRRSRAAKRIEALLRERHQLRQQVSEQQGALQQVASQQEKQPSEVSEESKIVEADTLQRLNSFRVNPIRMLRIQQLWHDGKLDMSLKSRQSYNLQRNIPRRQRLESNRRNLFGIAN